MAIDRRNRRYCAGAEANDTIHWGSGHRSVTAHYRFPCAKKKKRGGLENKKQKQNLCKDTRYARHPASVEAREDGESSENIQEFQRRYDGREMRLTGKHEAAAHEERETLVRKHTMTTTAAMHKESEVLERQLATTTAR